MVSAMIIKRLPKEVSCPSSPCARETTREVSIMEETWSNSVDWSTPSLVSRPSASSQIASNFEE